MCSMNKEQGPKSYLFDSRSDFPYHNAWAGCALAKSLPCLPPAHLGHIMLLFVLCPTGRFTGSLPRQAGPQPQLRRDLPLGWGDDLLGTGPLTLVSLPLNRVSCLLWAEDQGRAWAGMVSSTLSDLLFLPLPPPRTGVNSGDL